MDRKKRPALTSPWKIGFLVSLLLVIVSIGVGFAITRTFGVAWSWLHLGGGTWAFDLDAFLREMLPLVVMVPVLSLIAYFVITGAVRRYRAYLDSGLDYKHLLQALHKVDDLQENKLKSLGDYPELKDFLQKIRNRIGEREKKLEERTEALKAQKEETSSAEQFKAEASVLIHAINRGPVDGFSEELTLSVPEMKNVEQAIRDRLIGRASAVSMTEIEVDEHMAVLKDELVESIKTLKQMMAEMSAEMVASQNGAREIELHTSQLKMAIGADTAPTRGDQQQNATYTLALVDRLDQASASLAALAEETRGMAINTALQAGSADGGVTDLVKLADDVRDVASGFNAIAGQYQEIGVQLRTAVQSMPTTGPSAETDEMLETMSGKVKLWVERAMVLAEKLKAFERQFVEDTTSFEIKLGGGMTKDTYQDVPELSIDDGFGPYGTHAAEKVEKIPVDGFEARDAEASALESNSPRAGAGQGEDLFKEISGKSEGSKPEDNLFADIPPSNTEAEPRQVQQAEPPAQNVAPTPTKESTGEMFEEMDTSGPGDEPQLAPTPAASPAEPGSFVQSQVDLSKVDVEATTVPNGEGAPPVTPPPVETPPLSTATPATPVQTESTVMPDQQTEEPIYNLYDLGAVDYEPTVHQNA